MDNNVVNNFVRVTQEQKHVVVKGAGGLRGVQGPAGAGLEISGSVATYADLPWQLTIYDAGKAYFVQADGLLYIWTGERWPAEGEGAQFQGPQGIRGQAGADGAPGPANTLTIGTVTTGASAEATITGTSPNQVLNLTLPQGPAGQDGRDGQDAYIPDLASFKSAILDVAYPVGTIYTSTSNVSPETFLGGTWVQIKDTFLLTAGDTYTAGATGGEATHTLTVQEMPSHSHNFREYWNTYWDGATQDRHAVAYNDNTSGSSSAYTNNTGGGQAHNNMPPYLVVYAWERTA